jgi:hypothetical protein
LKLFDDSWIDLTWNFSMTHELTWLENVWIDLTWTRMNWLDLKLFDDSWIDLTWKRMTWLDLTWVFSMTPDKNKNEQINSQEK